MSNYDVVVVGAGISGIGAAYNLQKTCPTKSFTILEARDNIGGSWDLFKYPGIRSDSDMHTMGFRFKPWTDPKTIADGPSILKYLDEAVKENDLEEKIKFMKKVVSAKWSSTNANWTLTVRNTNNSLEETVTCKILYLCGGYYNYDNGYLPEFKGYEDFEGEIIHPQHWPEDLNYEGKKVVVIGSGATAVTIVPAMADKVSHITMLQRSPTYYMSAPDERPFDSTIKRFTSDKVGYFLIRWKNILLGRFFVTQIKKHPGRYRNFLINGGREHLGKDYDIDKHFTPRYDPWDQRLCFVPNGDMFESINSVSYTHLTLPTILRV